MSEILEQLATAVIEGNVDAMENLTKDALDEGLGAKEILDGHMCISGDVPAALLSLGTPDQVRDYCRTLIDKVGKGGGFFLTTGCECPIDAKFENVEAMIDTAKTYRGKH